MVRQKFTDLEISVLVTKTDGFVGISNFWNSDQSRFFDSERVCPLAQADQTCRPTRWATNGSHRRDSTQVITTKARSVPSGAFLPYRFPTRLVREPPYCVSLEGKMMDRTKTLQMVADILAATDIVWCPFRWSRNAGEAAAAIAEKRQLFLERGLQIVGGGTTLERQNHYVELRKLQSAGIIQLAGRGRLRCVKLTEKGDDIARHATPSITYQEGWALLDIVRELVDAGQHNSGHALEHDIIGTPVGDKPDVDAAMRLEDYAMPLLCRGLLTATSDTEGRMGYAITPAGRQAISDGPPDPLDNPPEYPGREFVDRFIDQYTAGLKARESWKPSHCNHVAIPLSAGMWAERQEAAT